MTDKSPSNYSPSIQTQTNSQQLHQAVERLILQWRLGHFNTLEDIWLNMQELQFHMGNGHDKLRKRLNDVMHEVAQALWNKYQKEKT